MKVEKIRHSESLVPLVTKFDVKKSKLYEHNLVPSLQKFQTGTFGPSNLKLTAENTICENLSTYRICSTDFFKRRITAITWHPTLPNIVAAGSKGGELLFRRFRNFYSEIDNISEIEGRGPDSGITYICFDPFSTENVYVSSIDGTVKKWNYEKSSFDVLLNTNDTKWFCSVNVSKETGLLVSGDSKGILHIFNKDQTTSTYKLHNGKINSVEFSNNNWLLATASLDKSAKIWDIRKIDPDKYLDQFVHANPVNSAYFSRTNGNRILTTDQNSQLRVYSTINFELETIIYHPHRQFQHLTPIRANWHPMADLIVVGRYPDPSWPHFKLELKSIDIMNASTGEMKVQLNSCSSPKISSLTQFNTTGEIICSGSGSNIAYWKTKHPRERPNVSDDSSDDDFFSFKTANLIDNIIQIKDTQGIKTNG